MLPLNGILDRRGSPYSARASVGDSFSPLDLSPVLWLDASDTSTITESGGSVSQWDDKSGNDYHATQGTGSIQPATGTRTVNGLNVLDYDGSNDALNLPSALYSLGTTDHTVIALISEDVAGFQRPIYGYGPVRMGLQQNGDATTARNGYTMGANGTTTLLDVPFDVNPHVWIGGNDGVNKYFYYDGIEDTDFQGSESTLTRDTLTSLYVGGAALFDGTIGEVLIFGRLLTDAEINQVGNYLSAKWGTTWTDI